jgi:hypothetical protein
VAAIDVEVAYLTAYDAMRIAVTAHMLAEDIEYVLYPAPTRR